jgi:hypothetical protein
MHLINRITSMLSRTSHTTTRRGRSQGARSVGFVERFLHRH